jgi:hypothetical protein
MTCFSFPSLFAVCSPLRQQNASQPVYDASAHHDGEGLYDEPAFNRDAQKANPVYQSTEDLAAASEYMEQPGGGKGDGCESSVCVCVCVCVCVVVCLPASSDLVLSAHVAPDLDVAPGAAEDVGYLDGVEKK